MVALPSAFPATVVEGQDAGAFTHATVPDDVVDLLLASFTGAMVHRVLHFQAPSAVGFWTARQDQTAKMPIRADIS